MIFLMVDPLFEAYQIADVIVSPEMSSTCDLRSPGWIKLKAVLFLVAGLLSSALLVLDTPTLRVVFLLGIAIWSFCRLYYFAFYVIERYVDPEYRFSGLVGAVRFLIWGRRENRSGLQPSGDLARRKPRASL
jgi:hypothetical protein